MDATTQKAGVWRSPFFNGRYAFFDNTYIDGPTGMDPFLQGVIWGRWWGRTQGGHNARVSAANVRNVPTVKQEIAGCADGVDPGDMVETFDLAIVPLFPWYTAAVGDSRIVMFTAVGKSGVENRKQTRQVREVVFKKGTGSPEIESLGTPNAPTALTIKPKADGSFYITFRYDSKNEERTPARFNIYWTTTGSFAFGTANQTVTYVSGQGFYEATTSVIASTGDTEVEFVVRASATDTDEGEERNLNTVRVVGRTTAPYGTVSAFSEVSSAGFAFPLREL